MKALVIGRHAGEVPGVEVIETRAVTFPVTAMECRPIIESLMAEAKEQDAAVLLQNTPGQVAVALADIEATRSRQDEIARLGGDDDNDDEDGEDAPSTCLYQGMWRTGKIGIVISVPGPRPGKVSKNIMTCDAEQVKEAVVFANPRAKATVFTDGYDEMAIVAIEVDGPPMPFVFSHIEWLF